MFAGKSIFILCEIKDINRSFFVLDSVNIKEVFDDIVKIREDCNKFLVGNYGTADIRVKNLWILLMAKILPYSGLCAGLEQNIRKQKAAMIASTVLKSAFMGVSDIAFIITVVLAKHEVIRDISESGTNRNDEATKKRGRERGKKDVIFLYSRLYIFC